MTEPPRAGHVEAPGLLDIGEDTAATISRTIERGWARVREGGVEAGTHEAVLNERLRDGMREEVNLGSSWRGRRIIVAQGTETLSTPDRATPDGRTDICIYFFDFVEDRQDHGPHAIIECKRVSGGDARLCRKYVEEGIERFRGGKYAVPHAAAFMVGYLESGDADLAVHAINRRLKRSERLRPGIAAEAEWSRRSRHPRGRGAAPIELHHVFLAFSVGRS